MWLIWRIGSYHGPLQMRIWSNYLRPRVRLTLQRSYLMAHGRRVLAWFSLVKLQRQRQPSVGSFLHIFRSYLKLWGDKAKFQQYMYGGRPLDVRFNDRWHTFTPTAAKGGHAVAMQPDGI